MNKLNWGIIGTGGIARKFARALQTSRTGQLFAVASRAQAPADAFAKEFGISRAHGTYESILKDTDVDAVYISTPHPFHAEWAIRAAEASKHILCEKPIAMNHAETMAIIEAADRNNVFLMEAFMFRCHPQTHKLMELIRQKVIGDVCVIHAILSFRIELKPEGRHFKKSLGGGVILDVGCYCASMARLIAGAEPIEVKGVGQLGPTGADDWAIASLKFPGGIVAQLSGGLRVDQGTVVRIYGTEGNIEIPKPWLYFDQAEPTSIIINRKNQPPQEIAFNDPIMSYTYEADICGDAIRAGKKQADAPAMTWADSLGNMKVLDQWREEVGLVYESEKPEGYPSVTVAGERLRARDKHNMKYVRLAGVDKPVSRLVMGCDNQLTLPHSAVMFDDFFEKGGNAFDTAWVYGGGIQEKLLGQWIKLRGVRKEVVIIAKGAHSPLCTPRDLTRQLHESLDRLGTDHAEIYLMHRDNLDVPVGEFVDLLNEHQKAGRFKMFGGSNWTLSRIDEANAYAKKKRLSGFSMLCNQFSLARMVNPIWKGALSAGDAESRAWLNRTQMPLLAWSSQSRGFFLPGRAAPNKLDDEEMVRSWYSPDNFQRLDRANELARKKKVEPINIALAYVLNQPFPTLALIGPRLLNETRTSLPSLDVELSEAEIRWLNLETPTLS